MNRCGICERRIDHDEDPFYVENDPGHYDDERFEVAMTNGLLARACWSCWMRIGTSKCTTPSSEPDWLGLALEVAQRTAGTERSACAQAARENAQRAVQKDPVRLAIEAEREWACEFYRRLMLSPDLETFEQLLRGDSVAQRPAA